MKTGVCCSVDQRGSVCGPDKLRFDFSHGKPVTAAEVGQVQDLVREVIATKGGCPLQKKEVALGDAKQIKSLRAVFGETYPDPVRVCVVCVCVRVCACVCVRARARARVRVRVRACVWCVPVHVVYSPVRLPCSTVA